MSFWAWIRILWIPYGALSFLILDFFAVSRKLTLKEWYRRFLYYPGAVYPMLKKKLPFITLCIVSLLGFANFPLLIYAWKNQVKSQKEVDDIVNFFE